MQNIDLQTLDKPCEFTGSFFLNNWQESQKGYNLASWSENRNINTSAKIAAEALTSNQMVSSLWINNVSKIAHWYWSRCEN